MILPFPIGVRVSWNLDAAGPKQNWITLDTKLWRLCLWWAAKVGGGTRIARQCQLSSQLLQLYRFFHGIVIDIGSCVRGWLFVPTATQPLVNPGAAGKRRAEGHEPIGAVPAHQRHDQRKVVRRRLADVDWQTTALSGRHSVVTHAAGVCVVSLVGDVCCRTGLLHSALGFTACQPTNNQPLCQMSIVYLYSAVSYGWRIPS